MEYTQIGRSVFLDRPFRNSFFIRKVVPFRCFLEKPIQYSEGIVLLTPKSEIFEYTANTFHFSCRSLVVISSIAVEVKSYSSKDFQMYRKFKSKIESTVQNDGEIKYIRCGMFLDVRKLRSLLIFFISIFGAIFAPKNRMYVYTTQNQLKKLQFDDKGVSRPVKTIKGLGIIKVKNRKFKRLLCKLYIKL